MGHVLVHGADVAGGRIERLRVSIPNLPPKTIDRDTAVRWMKDGHSLIRVIGGKKHTALQLVELDDAVVIRADNDKQPIDEVPGVPTTADAGI